MTHPIHPCEIRAFSRKNISAIVPGHVTQLGIFSASKRIRNHSRVHLRETYISNGTCKGDIQCAQPHRASQGEKYHCAPTTSAPARPSQLPHFLGVAFAAPPFFPNRASRATAALALAASFFAFLLFAFSTRPFAIAAFAEALTAIAEIWLRGNG